LLELPPELEEAEELPKLRVDEGLPLELEAHAPIWLKSGFLSDEKLVRT
jgi:hypothetical protein